MSDKLSVVHFSTADNEGGSGRSAYRIHSGLRDLGHESRMLVGRKSSADTDVDTVHRGEIGRLADRVADIATSAVGMQYQYFPSGHRVLRHRWVKQADIFQLYNTHGGYFSQRMLPGLSRRAPVVWRLSDMWPVTGHCAYAGSCDNWKTGCGNCCSLDNYPPISRDTARFLWTQKKRLYDRSRITVVAPSSWTEGVARASALLGSKEVVRIPNGLDLNMFYQRDRREARARLGLPEGTAGFLFVANEVNDNPRKGSAELVAALNVLGSHSSIRVMVAGLGGDKLQRQIPQQVIDLGYLRDDSKLAEAYSAADAVVAPSMEENLPNTILEAMACSTPVIAYDTGGIKDAVINDQTGLLVRRGDHRALADGIARLESDTAMRRALGHAGRMLIEQEFSAVVQARRFESLYLRLAGK